MSIAACGGQEIQGSEVDESQDSIEGEIEIQTAESDLSFNSGVDVCDGGTTCYSVYGMAGVAHCCPTGYAMYGAHISSNVFYCREVVGGLKNAVVDFSTTCNGMHCCPFGKVMVGYQHAMNWLICAEPKTQSVSVEYVDVSTTNTCGAVSMHTCSSNANPNAYAMSGIHAGANHFTCAR